MCFKIRPGFYLLYIFFLLNLGQVKSHLFQRHKFSQRSLEKILKPNVSASLLFKIKAPWFPHAYEIDGRCPGSLLPAQSPPTHCRDPISLRSPCPPSAENPYPCAVSAHPLLLTTTKSLLWNHWAHLSKRFFHSVHVFLAFQSLSFPFFESSKIPSCPIFSYIPSQAYYSFSGFRLAEHLPFTAVKTTAL